MIRWHCRVIAARPMEAKRPVAAIEADNRNGVIDLLYKELRERPAEPISERYEIDIWSDKA